MSVSFTGRTSQTCWPLSCCEYLCCLPGGRHKLAALCLAVSICVVYLEDITDFLLFVLPCLCHLLGGHHRLAGLCLAVSICVVYLEDVTNMLLFVLPWVSVSFTWRMSQTCSLSCREYPCCLPGGCYRLSVLCLAMSICVVYLEEITDFLLLSCCEYLCCLPGWHHRLSALCLVVSIGVVYLEDITGFLPFVLPWVSVLALPEFTWRIDFQLFVLLWVSVLAPPTPLFIVTCQMFWRITILNPYPLSFFFSPLFTLTRRMFWWITLLDPYHFFFLSFFSLVYSYMPDVLADNTAWPLAFVSFFFFALVYSYTPDVLVDNTAWPLPFVSFFFSPLFTVTCRLFRQITLLDPYHLSGSFLSCLQLHAGCSGR